MVLRKINHDVAKNDTFASHYIRSKNEMLKLDQTKTDKTKKEEDEEEDDDEDDDDDDQENFFDDFLDLKFNNRAEIERAKKDVRA